MENETFVWTKELKRDFANILVGCNTSVEETLAIFKIVNKQSKQQSVVNKDWEIESYINTTNDEVFTIASVWNNSMYRKGFKDYTSEFKNQECFKIHSVIRISDDSRWSVKDNTQYGVIKGFYKDEENGEMMVFFETPRANRALYELSKVAIKKSSFTIEQIEEIKMIIETYLKCK